MDDRFDDHDGGQQTAQIIDAADLFTEWRRGLMYSDKGKAPKPCTANVLHALRKAPKWKGVLYYDEFAHRIMVGNAPPWVAPEERGEWKARPWSDNDDMLTLEWMQRQGIMVKLGDIGHAITSVARENGRNPVHEYLESLHWDGVERLDTVMPQLFGVEVNAYTSDVFSKTGIAAVARAMTPGCKVDTVLTLEGPQGKQKSSAIKKLFGKEWFTDDLSEIGTKDSAMQMQGVWVVEIADLAAMKRADIDKVKAFITREIDRFRPPYAKNVIAAARASIMISTANRDDWGKDETGGRRFWPVQCKGEIDPHAIEQLRDQLWAEAYARWKSGEGWWLTNPDVIAMQKREIKGRAPDEPWTETVMKYAAAHTEGVTTAEILSKALNIDIDRQEKGHAMRVAEILRQADWIKWRQPTGARATLWYPDEAAAEAAKALEAANG